MNINYIDNTLQRQINELYVGDSFMFKDELYIYVDHTNQLNVFNLTNEGLFNLHNETLVTPVDIEITANIGSPK